MPNEPTDQEIFEKLKKMKQFSDRISKRHVPEAESSFKTLRKRGYNLEEMEQMTDGLWKKKAIQPYIAHVRPEKDLPPSTATLDEIGDMIKSGITKEQATVANSVYKTLDGAGVKLEEVSELISQSRNAGMSIQLLVSTVKEIKQSGMPIGEFGEAYRYRKLLEGMNVSSKSLGKLVDAIAKQGDDIDKTIEAVNTLGDLNARKASWQADHDLQWIGKRRYGAPVRHQGIRRKEKDYSRSI